MREAVHLRWIEQAEARQMLTTVQSERLPRHSYAERPRVGMPDWLPRVRSWLFPEGTALQAQLVPIPVRCNRD